MEKIVCQCSPTNINVKSFSDWLYETLYPLIEDSRAGLIIDREKLWTLFHQVRSANIFDLKWKDFLTVFHVDDPDPVLYQHLSIVYFKKLITCTLPVHDKSSPPNDSELSYEESNAITYIGGYLIRSIWKEGSKPNLAFLIKSSGSAIAESEEWLYTIDRGGLIYITESFSDMITSMERVIRRECSSGSCFDKNKLHQALLDDSDTLFNWSIASRDVEDDDEKTAIFDLIARKYITVRGFSFSKSILEKFKQEQCKGTQKSKPLRSKVSDK